MASEQSIALLPTDINALKRRRGVARSSVTRLATRLRDLENGKDQPDTAIRAKQLMSKLSTVDAEFKFIHLQIIDLLDNEEELEAQQGVFDDHEDKVSALFLRLHQLTRTTSPSPAPSATSAERTILAKKLHHLERCINAAKTAITGLPDELDDLALIAQYEAQLADYKSQLVPLRDELLLSGDILEDDALLDLHAELEQQLFDCSHVIRRHLARHDTERTPTAPVASSGVKLPKLDVPVFDGNIINWTKFWEQFHVSVHNRTNITEAEKLVYLQHALKDGSAKTVIEGLTRSGEHYVEAIDCLKARFDRPRLVHQTHVKNIIESPPLKQGSGKELRRLHDTVQQHIRALKAMGHEPSASFITSIIELKLDSTTMFEWQRHTQSETTVPHYSEILEFIDHRAQASESIGATFSKGNTKNNKKLPGHIPSFTSSTSSACIACKAERHPLYICQTFKGLSHEQKISMLKSNNICMNCLTSGHHSKSCKSVHRCRRCQALHHTLLHSDDGRGSHPPVTSNSAVELDSSCLLMTCKVILSGPAGSCVEARCLLDNASSASFVTERIAQALRLPRSFQSISVSGIEGLSSCITNRAVSQITASPVGNPNWRIGVTAVIVPRVTADLPVKPIPFGLNWDHLSDITLSDPAFGEPGRIDALLGIDVFIGCLLKGRLAGPPGSPTAFETVFGWVLGGLINSSTCNTQVTTHISISCLNDTICRFWEIEEPPSDKLACSMEERAVMQHFQDKHYRTPLGRFVVPLPRKLDIASIGESRSQAIRRFLALERNLNSKGKFSEVDSVMLEYLKLGHAEEVPVEDFDKPTDKVFYLPMHVVYKESSTTTRIRAVFDASAKSMSGISLNDTLLVGPTVHPPLLDVLIRFRYFCIPLITDVSKMYRAVELENEDKDFHRFVWRSSPNDVIRDYRMTRLTFGVSASCFAANMSIKQNAIDFMHEFPLAAKMVSESFYVDDGLLGAGSVEEAIELRKEMQELFSRGGFLLRKWNSTNKLVLESIEHHLRDVQEVHSISGSMLEYTKTLGLEWNVKTDSFRVTVSDSFCSSKLTKRTLVSNIAKVFDVLGWFSPAIIKIKILLQRLWELGIDWDDLAPPSIAEVWVKWESEFSCLSSFHIQRFYFSDISQLESFQLHGFSDASEDAYAAVVYIRSQDTDGNIGISLVIAKSRVSPIRRMSIPRLELCGAQLLSQLLHYLKGIFNLELSSIFAWTDSNIVLNWLQGSSRRFKVFVGNRISSIIDRIPADRWAHVQGTDNPADAPSRGLFPSELVSHDLWWNGPPWLRKPESEWPYDSIPSIETLEEERVTSHFTGVKLISPIIPVRKYSSFHKLLRITSWVYRFITSCRGINIIKPPYLLVGEIRIAKRYWIHYSQRNHFILEINLLLSNCDLPNGSSIIPLHPFVDKHNILRVGGRLANSKLSFSQKHPIILHEKDAITQLLVHTEHIILLHAGPTLLMASLSRDYHIIGLRRAARSVTRKCVICSRQSARTESQLMGQLPLERINPGLIFENVGLDYDGPILIKYGHVRRPTIVKAYIAVFVSMSVKAVHLELVTDLTSEAFIACLRRFVARRGCPNQIWSDHGSNFVGAKREISEFYNFLSNSIVQCNVSQFCHSREIEWKFIPERAPNFGGLWEATVKSMKTHLKRVTNNVKLTYEEMSTILTQIEACLNSRPLTSIPSSDSEGIEVLTPGHFLIGRPLLAVPDPPSSHNHSITLLRRWQLCQAIV